MQVQRNIELFQLRPEGHVARIVEINDCVGISDLRETIDHGPFETQFRDTARQLGDCRLRILHRQRGEAGKAIRAFGNELCQSVVGLASDFNSPPGVRYALDGRIV